MWSSKCLGTLVLIVVATSGCTSGHSLNPGRALQEDKDRSGNPTSVGVLASKMPVAYSPIDQAQGNTEITHEVNSRAAALDSAAVLECKPGSPFNLHSIDAYEIERFDKQRSFELSPGANSEAYINEALKRLADLAPSKAERLRQLIGTESSKIIGAPRPSDIPDSELWVPNDCALRHVVLITAESGVAKYLWNHELFAKLEPLQAAMVRLHAAIAAQAIEEGEQRFTAARRFNRALFWAIRQSFDSYLALEYLMTPNKPIEFSFLNGDRVFALAKSEDDLISNLGRKLAVDGCGYQLKGEPANLARCNDDENALGVFAKGRERIMRITEPGKADPVFLFDPGQLGLPANTKDYHFDHWDPPQPMARRSGPKELRLKVADPFEMRFPKALFHCAPNEWITLKGSPADLVDYRVDMKSARVTDCKGHGMAELNVMGQAVSIPTLLNETSLSSPDRVVFLVDYLSSQTLHYGGYSFPIANSYFSLNRDGSLRIRVRGQHQPVSVKIKQSPDCPVMVEEIVISQSDFYIDGLSSQVCTIRGERSSSKLHGNVVVDMNKQIVRSFYQAQNIYYDSLKPSSVTYGKIKKVVDSASFNEQGDPTQIHILKANEERNATYYSHQYHMFLSVPDMPVYATYRLCYDSKNSRWEFPDLSPNCGPKEIKIKEM